MSRLFSKLVTRLAVRATRVFYEIVRVGPAFPEGPLLVTANHPNSMMDALVLFTASGRGVRPLARAPLFDRALLGPILRGLGGLPVYRRQDDPEQMHRNEETFEAAVDALRAGDAVLIFPEGMSHSEPGVIALRTGAARIALRAEERAGWSLGLRILPVGLTYERKAFFRGRVTVAVGEAFAVAGGREASARDPQDAVRALTARIGEALEQVVVRLSSWEDWAIVSAAQEIFVREKGWVGARQEDAPAAQWILRQRFAEGLAWLRSADPERAERLAQAVLTYRRRTQRLGATRGDVPDTYALWETTAYALRAGAPLLALAPLAAAGATLWYLPFRLPSLAVRLLRPQYEAIASIKLTAGLVGFALAYAAYLAVAWQLGGAPWLAIAAVALPITGFITLAWHERSEDLREDARILWRALRRQGLRQQLRARRSALVAEFERLAAEWERERNTRDAANAAPGPA